MTKVIVFQLKHLISFFNSFFSLAAAAAKSLQSCPTLCDPIDGSPPAPPSLGFSRQEHWGGLLFPSPMRESEVAQSFPTLSDPMDCSLPGSSVHGIFQERVLEWVAIAFSSPQLRHLRAHRIKHSTRDALSLIQVCICVCICIQI